MAKNKSAGAGTFRRELFQAGVYKRSQGRVARQVTFAAMAVTIGLGLYSFQVMLSSSETFAWLLRSMKFGAAARGPVTLAVPLVLFVTGLWLSFRAVNWPKFADFLIAVEAEMNKVSWPTRSELWRSSLVVIFTIFFLATILALYDVAWGAILNAIFKLIEAIF